MGSQTITLVDREALQGTGVDENHNPEFLAKIDEVIACVNTLIAAGTGPTGPPGQPSPPTGPAGGDLTGTYPNPELAAVSGFTAGSFSDPTSVTVDSKGRVTAVTASTDPPLRTSARGAVNGVASLDSTGRVPSAQLTVDVLEFQGSWDASTNTPTLASGTGTVGHLYVVSVAGSTLLDGVSTWTAGDYVIFEPGNTWARIQTTAGAAPPVTSVNSETGDVVLDIGDIGPMTLAELNAAVSDATLDTSSASRTPSGAAGGDLGGNFPNPQVNQIRGLAVSSTAPTDGQVLVYRTAGTQLQFEDQSGAGGGGAPSGPAGGDLTGNYPNPELAASGVTAAQYTYSTVTVDAKGRITAASSGAAPIPATERGMANGVATLDSTSRIPVGQLPIQALTHQGAWNADTNTPTLASGTGNDGDVYWVTVAGTTSLDAGTTGSNTWAVGDALIFVAATSTWHRIPASAAASAVQSVNGQTGTVTIDFSTLQGGTLAQLNALVTDGTLDLSTDSRSPDGAAGGDLTSNYPNPTVRRIQGRDVDTGAPSVNQALIWNADNSEWEPQDIVNSLGGLSGVITQTQLQGLVQGVAAPPVATVFHTNAPPRVDVGSTLTGNNYVATYTLDNSTSVATARLVGFPTATPANLSVIVGSASKDEGPNIQAFTFPNNADFSVSGNQYTIRLELYHAGQTVGVDTPITQVDTTIIAQAALRDDILYYGSSTDSTPGNVTPANLSSQTNLSGAVTVPTFTGSEFLIFAYPASADLVTEVLLDGVNQIAAFTLTEDAIQINSTNYDVLISKEAQLGATLSGDIITLVR